MFIKENFIARLKTLREAKGVSTRKLGGAIGISSPAISQFENGTALPAIDTLVALAKFFDVSVDYLLGISDEPKPIPEKSDQTDKQPGQVEMDTLLNELNEESVAELKKYAEYLKIKQTLDSGNNESSAGLDGNVGSKE